MDVQALVRWLLPKDDVFFTLLEQHAAVTQQAAAALSRLTDAQSVEAVRAEVSQFEHQADAIIEQFEEALARTFVTPIDREDLHKLASELDDIVDLTYATALACSLFAIEKFTPPMQQLLDILRRTTEAVAAALPNLRLHKYDEIPAQVRNIRSLEREGDQVYRSAVSHLFKDEATDAKRLMREREVLDHLESAIDHCHHVANTLANLAIKHG